MPISFNQVGITGDITNPLNIPVYNPGCTAYIPVNFYSWCSPFHTSPIGIEENRPDSYFTGLSAPVFSDEAHKYVAPISTISVIRQSSNYKTSFSQYIPSTYNSNIARNYVLTGLTGGLGEATVNDWTNQLTGPREVDLGKMLAFTIEMHTRYYNHRGMTGCYIPAIMLLQMFRPYAEYISQDPTAALASGVELTGPTASWLAVFNHPNDVLTMAGGTYGMATGDIERLKKTSPFISAGLSGAIYGVDKIFQSFKTTMDARIPFTPGMTYPKYLVSDIENVIYRNITSTLDVTYAPTVSLTLTGVTSGSFAGHTMYTTPVWPFLADNTTLDSTRSYPLAIRKYTHSGGATGTLQVVKLSTGTASTWTGKTGNIGLTHTSGVFEIVSASSAVNFTKNPDAKDVTYINTSAPYAFVNIPASATGNLGLAVTGQTHDAGYWPQVINDPKALTYKFFTTGGPTLFELWGRTGPFYHGTTNGCNYSPNQYRPSQYLSAATPSNDPTFPGGITLPAANIWYTGHGAAGSAFDTNPTFNNWLSSFQTAYVYGLMDRVYAPAKTYFPNLKILGEYDFMMGSKQYPVSRNKVFANTYEMDLYAGYVGPAYASSDSLPIFPSNLDGAAPLWGTNFLDSSDFNIELMQVYGDTATTSYPHEMVSAGNRSGWVGSGYGPSGGSGPGLSAADGISSKKRYRAFLERCYAAGMTGVSGGFNLTGPYSVDLGIAGYVSNNDSYLNQQDFIKARLKFNLKQMEQMANNVAYFDSLSSREFYIAPWFTESEVDEQGSTTGSNYTLSLTDPPQKPWPRIRVADTSYPLFKMHDVAGAAVGATAMMHPPSQYDYFSLIRQAVWNYGAGPFFVFAARGLINKPSYAEQNTPGVTGISGAIKMFLDKDRYNHVEINTYDPSINFTGTPGAYGNSTLYATFTSDVQSGTSPTTVVFDSSESWNPGGTATWYFEGTLTGPSGQGVTASHQYVGAGSYNVRLDIANAYGSDTLTRGNYIVISGESVTGSANVVGIPTSGFAPLTVSFADTSTINPVDYATTYQSVTIDFGDENSASMLSGNSLISVDHVYAAAGDYTVTYSMTWASGLTSSIVKSNYITVYEQFAPPSPPPGNGNSLNHRFIGNPRRVVKGRIIANQGRFDIIR